MWELVARSKAEGFVDIDDFAEGLAPLALTIEAIEIAIDLFEARGGVLRAPAGGGGPERLKTVLETARTLAQRLGRVPTVAEIAESSKMDVALVRHALALGRVMGR